LKLATEEELIKEISKERERFDIEETLKESYSVNNNSCFKKRSVEDATTSRK
jgi:hypothetical protein